MRKDGESAHGKIENLHGIHGVPQEAKEVVADPDYYSRGTPGCSHSPDGRNSRSSIHLCAFLGAALSSTGGS